MRSPNTPTAKARRLTVGYCWRWLRDAGFTIGQHIKVEVGQGRLTIAPAD